MRALYGRPILLVSWLVAACGLDLNGAGVAADAKDGGPGPDATVNDSATAPHEDASASDAPSADDAGADVGVTLDANVPPDSGDAGAPLATSCKTLLAANPSTLGKNGFYTIDTDGADAKAPFSVYCEMSLDGGGWTLVGHSAPGGTPPFGWTTATGTASNLNSPFSLDVAATGLVFSEVLLAEQVANSLDAGVRAYKLGVPADLVNKYLDAAVSTASVTTLIGPCKPPGGPTMLTNAGGTSVTDSFFFRDNATFNDPSFRFGLLAHGFETYYFDCPKGADLNGQQGLIFVR